MLRYSLYNSGTFDSRAAMADLLGSTTVVTASLPGTTAHPPLMAVCICDQPRALVLWDTLVTNHEADGAVSWQLDECIASDASDSLRLAILTLEVTEPTAAQLHVVFDLSNQGDLRALRDAHAHGGLGLVRDSERALDPLHVLHVQFAKEQYVSLGKLLAVQRAFSVFDLLKEGGFVVPMTKGGTDTVNAHIRSLTERPN